MNITEFAALKVGDRISNPFSEASGTVTAVFDTGVSVLWDGSKPDLARHYAVNSTIWMHWTKSQ